MANDIATIRSPSSMTTEQAAMRPASQSSTAWPLQPSPRPRHRRCPDRHPAPGRRARHDRRRWRVGPPVPTSRRAPEHRRGHAGTRCENVSPQPPGRDVAPRNPRPRAPPLGSRTRAPRSPSHPTKSRLRNRYVDLVVPAGRDGVLLHVARGASSTLRAGLPMPGGLRSERKLPPN
jgi:hypothetical protein